MFTSINKASNKEQETNNGLDTRVVNLLAETFEYIQNPKSGEGPKWAEMLATGKALDDRDPMRFTESYQFCNKLFQNYEAALFAIDLKAAQLKKQHRHLATMTIAPITASIDTAPSICTDEHGYASLSFPNPAVEESSAPSRPITRTNIIW